MRRLWLCLLALPCAAQDFTHRGFFESQFVGYPQAAPNDSGRAIGEWLLRYEPAYKLSPGWRVAASVDARTDTHRQVDRTAHLAWFDRERKRPALTVRRLSARFHRGPVTLDLGKQFIRWGKADILNPTDRFAPRDFLTVVDNDFLAVPAARLAIERGGETLDLVWQPRFTPSRTPLLNQRWVVLPAGLRVIEAGARYPGGSQFGARWNHLGSGYEFSTSFYEGHNHLPLLDATALPYIRREYAQMRMYGADAAVPLKPFTVKAEAAYYTSSTPAADNYALYVLQLERQYGEWSFVGGYAGQAVTRSRVTSDFSPDRGLARAFLGRASYSIDPNRRLAFETALRQNGDGVWLKGEYSQAIGPHWRATAGFTLIRGAQQDFLGQYRRNSHATLSFRYSF